MRVDLPTPLVIALNVAGWPVIHLAVAWLFTRLPARLFRCERPSPWSPGAAEAKLYTKLAGVRVWKKLLPDGAPWLRGFAKRSLRSKDPEYLRSFIAETRRGELAHWVMLSAGCVFFLWNPPWADAVMASYAVLANAPCIITQRYNRRRLRSLLDLLDARRARTRPAGKGG